MMCGHTNMRRTFAGDVTLLDRDSRLPSFRYETSKPGRNRYRQTFCAQIVL